MKIESSAVQLQSQRSYSKVSEEKSLSVQITSASVHKLDLSDPSKSKFEQLSDVKDQLELQAKEQEEENKEAQKEAQKKAFENFLEQMKKNQKVSKQQKAECKSLDEMRIELMKRILKLLRGEKIEDEGTKEMNDFAQAFNSQACVANSTSLEAPAGTEATGTTGIAGVIGAGNARAFTRVTVASSFMLETENTAFQGQGTVRTADGREIDFGITVEMSRAFCQQNEAISTQTVIMCDPLVINMSSDVAEVSDQKFLFDLDADGEKEEISTLSGNSGYLALDKNGDGKINDGSELFGTKSGDGFADLAKYDSDGNGWIDENDEIFGKLKVWTKNENGEDVLMDLKKADVGAIYLGKTSTQFSLNSMEDNHTNGAIRSTGVYLKESGGVGTVQHVDMAI